MPQPMSELYAYLGLDEQGNEGFVMVQITPKEGATSVVQLVAPNREIADQYRNWAEAVAKNTGKRVRLVRFSNPQQLETFE